MPQICDMGQTALLPLRRKACCGFFRPENPPASAWFEPAILGTIDRDLYFDVLPMLTVKNKVRPITDHKSPEGGVAV
jgi:hypothetical protein